MGPDRSDPGSDSDSTSDPESGTGSDSESGTGPEPPPKPVPGTDPDPDPTPAAQHAITYDLNGGKLDGQEGTVTVEYSAGTVITLPAPTRDGYVFDYWEGSKHNAGDEYTVNGDHTFKAIWKTAEKESGGGSSGQGSAGRDSSASSSSSQADQGKASSSSGIPAKGSTVQSKSTKTTTVQSGTVKSTTAKTIDEAAPGVLGALILVALFGAAGTVAATKKRRSN